MLTTTKYGLVGFLIGFSLMILSKVLLPVLLIPGVVLSLIGMGLVLAPEIKETKIATSKFKAYGMKVRGMQGAEIPDEKDFKAFFLYEIERFTEAGFKVPETILEGFIVTYYNHELEGININGDFSPLLAQSSPWGKRISISKGSELLHTGILGHEMRLSMVYLLDDELGESKTVSEKELMKRMNRHGIYNNGTLYGLFKD